MFNIWNDQGLGECPSANLPDLCQHCQLHKHSDFAREFEVNGRILKCHKPQLTEASSTPCTRSSVLQAAVWYNLNDRNKLSVQLFWAFVCAILQCRCDVARTTSSTAHPCTCSIFKVFTSEQAQKHQTPLVLWIRKRGGDVPFRLLALHQVQYGEMEKNACFKNACGKAQDGEPTAKSVKGKKHQAYGGSKAAWL